MPGPRRSERRPTSLVEAPPGTRLSASPPFAELSPVKRALVAVLVSAIVKEIQAEQPPLRQPTAERVR